MEAGLYAIAFEYLLRARFTFDAHMVAHTLPGPEAAQSNHGTEILTHRAVLEHWTVSRREDHGGVSRFNRHNR